MASPILNTGRRRGDDGYLRLSFDAAGLQHALHRPDQLGRAIVALLKNPGSERRVQAVRDLGLEVEIANFWHPQPTARPPCTGPNAERATRWAPPPMPYMRDAAMRNTPNVADQSTAERDWDALAGPP